MPTMFGLSQRLSIFNHIAVFRDVVSKLWATEDLKLSDVTEVGHL